MQNVLVTGVSSGIGNTLAKFLVKRNFRVWGVARRRHLLEQLKNELKSKNFFYSVADVAERSFWKHLIKEFCKKKFIPQIIIFNAAINQNDLSEGINLNKLRNMMDVNFFSILEGVKLISDTYSSKLHFIAISSTSAFKGNHNEGIGYAASKGALTIAFESLFQKHFHSNTTHFTTIFLGPVKTDMIRFTKTPPVTLDPEQAAEEIVKAIHGRKPFYYYPKKVFVLLSIMRLLPRPLFFKIWDRLQKPFTKKE